MLISRRFGRFIVSVREREDWHLRVGKFVSGGGYAIETTFVPNEGSRVAHLCEASAFEGSDT